MVKHQNTNTVGQNIPTNLELTHRWTSKWRIKFNEDKSINVVFTKCHGVTSDVFQKLFQRAVECRRRGRNGSDMDLDAKNQDVADKGPPFLIEVKKILKNKE